MAPLLIGSFAFNFNNFNLIFLLTQGGPPVIGAEVPVGHTDILISFTFNLASSSGRGNNFGLAIGRAKKEINGRQATRYNNEKQQKRQHTAEYGKPRIVAIFPIVVVIR